VPADAARLAASLKNDNSRAPSWKVGMPLTMRTKGEIEAAISEAIVRFEIDYMGRGPKETQSHIVDDLIVVRLKGMLTPAEQQLAKSPDGVELIKKMRLTIIDNAKAEFSRVITHTTGVAVRDILTDISTGSGERIFVFILERNLGRELQRRSVTA
jgi:uncharacterized protein YbcI